MDAARRGTLNFGRLRVGISGPMSILKDYLLLSARTRLFRRRATGPATFMRASKNQPETITLNAHILSTISSLGLDEEVSTMNENFATRASWNLHTEGGHQTCCAQERNQHLVSARMGPYDATLTCWAHTPLHPLSGQATGTSHSVPATWDCNEE